MHNVSEMNQELVRAFNVILCHNEVAITNLTVQNLYRNLRKENHIVISFNKGMNTNECMDWLKNMKEKIVETFCGDESTASISFDMRFFPFKFNKKQLIKDVEGRYKFSVPIDSGVVFNLKYLLANGLAKDVAESIGSKFGAEYAEKYTDHVEFNRKSYLYCMRFHNRELQKSFVELFSSKIQNYKSGPKKIDDFLEDKGNCVYIKENIFNTVEFIKDIVKHKASLLCRDFEIPSVEDEVVENLKFPIIDLLRTINIPVDSVFHVSYTGSGENSVLVPMIQITSGIGGKENCRFLNKEEVDYINKVFGITVLNNIEGYTSPKRLPVFGNRGVYGIDFYNQNISYCIMNKIIESSVINENLELSIDPELRFRAFSPLVSPAHKSKPGPSGGSPAKEQNIIQRTWNRFSGKSSKENPPAISPVHESEQGLSTMESTSLGVAESGYGSGSSPEASPPQPPTDDTKAVPQGNKACRKLFSDDPPQPNLDLTVGGIQSQQSVNAAAGGPSNTEGDSCRKDGALGVFSGMGGGGNGEWRQKERCRRFEHPNDMWRQQQ